MGAGRAGNLRRALALGLALPAMLALAGPEARAATGAAIGAATPPNILLVIADDMGLDASPCHTPGAAKPAMPVLEAMCRDGLVFDNVWSQPVCSPTRATILTGRYGFRTGVTQVAGGRDGGPGIGLDETSLQRLLDERAPVAYAHAVIGKWHLADAGNGGDDNPARMGVGTYAGLLRGALRDYSSFPLTTNGATARVDGYATTVFTDLAIDWLARQTGPWFLWLAHVAPHAPFHTPPEGLSERRPEGNDPLNQYLAALEALDHETGRLLASLDDETRANTIVIFLGDNGTPNRVAQAPYGRRNVKGTLYPGGIRVPMVVAGAGVTRKGEREAAPVNTTDLFATIADLAGIAGVEAEDSVSFRPLLARAGTAMRSFVYADLESGAGARAAGNDGWTVGDGRYQFLKLDGGGRHLFDVAADPAGDVDLLARGAADAEAIAARLEAIGVRLRAGN